MGGIPPSNSSKPQPLLSSPTSIGRQVDGSSGWVHEMGEWGYRGPLVGSHGIPHIWGCGSGHVSVVSGVVGGIIGGRGEYFGSGGPGKVRRGLCGGAINASVLLEHTTTLRMNTLKGYRGLTENKGRIEWIFIDKDSHYCSGNSKRIRLKNKYATRPTIYTKR